MVFHNLLGSMGDKMDRMSRLAHRLPIADAELKTCLIQATEKCKIGIASDIAAQYPSLLGFISSHLISQQIGDVWGINKVSQGVEEHELPISIDGALPQTEVGMYLSLIDKIDTLVGFFACEIPLSGSSDPYGLRKIAQKIVYMYLNLDIPISLESFVRKAVSCYQPEMLEKSAIELYARAGAALSFIEDRSRQAMKKRGCSEKAIAIASPRFPIDAQRHLAIVQGLSKWLEDGCQVKSVLDTLQRCVKMVDKTGEAGSVVERGLITENGEAELYIAMDLFNERVKLYDVGTQLDTFAIEVMPFVNNFFDNVFIMDKNHVMRKNRLAIVKMVSDFHDSIMNLRKP